MKDCEICGSAPATIKASIDRVILQVCQSCSSAGKILEAPLEKKSKISMIAQMIPQIEIEKKTPSSEELVVADFGKIISLARQKTGMKQGELASKMNEKIAVIHAAEQGKRLDLALARKFEKFLGVRLTEIQ
ncbi:MAG TPA: multiprotein-bridging factor 1 family protein [Nanoarchaeota archaeon]|nr:multiprotein-bridging factor 1 family protein [Nanoarchaeota archaeon]